MAGVVTHFGHACYEATCGFLRDKMTASLVVAGMTLPIWHALLKSASENAALLAPIVFLGVAVLKLYNEWPQTKSERVEKITALASRIPKLKTIGLWALAVVTVGAVFLFVSRSDAKAAPATLPSATVARKRKPNDDAGDEGEADVADPDEAAAPPWFWTAKEQVGVNEQLPNGRANPDVKAMFAAVDGYNPETVDCRKVPWCAVFINWALQNGKGGPGTRSAGARSFSRSRNFTKLEEPRIGCIVVMWRGQYDDGEHGHVGFYAGDGGRYINVLGGNQGDAVGIAKFPKSRVIGYFWPRGKWESRTNRAAAASAVGGTVGTGAVGYAALADETPEATGPSVVDVTTGVLEKLQEPLAQSGHPKAMKIAMLIGLALMVVAVGGALAALYYRSGDHSAGH